MFVNLSVVNSQVSIPISLIVFNVRYELHGKLGLGILVCSTFRLGWSSSEKKGSEVQSLPVKLALPSPKGT